MPDPLDFLELAPSAPQTGTVIWLHGLGASGHDFVPVAPLLARPDVRFLFPNAPWRAVTINGGFVMPAWYDIRSLARTADREHPEHIREAAGQLTELVAAEVAHPHDRLVLIGFSQGAAMALHLGLRHPETLAGVAALSGYLVLEDSVVDERAPANAATPFFFGHGTRDPVVPVAGGRHAHDTLESLGHPTTWVERPRMGHEVDAEEIAALKSWIDEVLPA